MKKQTQVSAVSFALGRIANKIKYKRVIAANLAIFSTVFSVATVPTSAFDYKTTDSQMVDATHIELTPTESAYMFPVVQPLGISQWYSKYHPGIDIRAPKGTPVVSVADGTVIGVQHLKSGYGTHVRIAHAGTVSSLYAHLNSVNVSVGQTVNKGQVIGTIGTTGWATGPHLHFELTDGASALNPKMALAI